MTGVAPATVCEALAETTTKQTQQRPDQASWINLVDDDLTQWRGYRMSHPPAGWIVKDGMIVRQFRPGQEHAEFADGGGDLITREQFADFELEFEFKIEQGGNSGVIYRLTEGESRSYWTGPEYQIMERPDRKRNPALHFCGANYALEGPDREYSNGPECWNQTRIVVRGNEVEHWLNEHQTVAYEIGSPNWKTLVAGSKFSDRPGYAASRFGHIALQDHGAAIAFRNVRVRRLSPDDRSPALIQEPDKPDWWPLFDGQHLENWYTWLGIPDRSVKGLPLKTNEDGTYSSALGLNTDPREVFRIVEQDGQSLLRVSGEIYGALTTLQEFDDFHLRLEFKWGKKRWPPRESVARNSGVLYYATGRDGEAFTQDQAFMRSLECEIREGDVGDLFLLSGPQATVRAVKNLGGAEPNRLRFDLNGAPRLVPPESGRVMRILKSADHEREFGAWNTLEIIACDGHCFHVLNDHVVMQLKNPTHDREEERVPLSAGQIQIQSEGAEVFFRDIQIRRLTRLPDLSGHQTE
jgi:hypothetical protein